MVSWFKKRGRREPVYPSTPGGVVLYAVGDVHGRLDLLERLHAAIDADAANHDVVATEIYLGDYVDRGPDSKGVIDRLIERFLDHRTRRRMIFLAGNHEELFSAFLDGALDPEEWRRVGGWETALSYGIDVRGLARAPKERWIAALVDAVPRPHRIFLDALHDSYAEAGYFFTHAGVRPGVPLDEQAPDDLRWIRDEFLGDESDHGMIVVHGHTPSEAPELLANRINLDTGAYMTNRLTCLAIDAGGPRIL